MTRIRWQAAGLVVATGLTAVLTGCSSSDPTGPPSCTDTSAAGSRLAGGCVHDGKTFPAQASKCVDGTTLYNIPDGEASAFSNGTLRTRTATLDELSRCSTGQSLSGAPSS